MQVVRTTSHAAIPGAAAMPTTDSALIQSAAACERSLSRLRRAGRVRLDDAEAAAVAAAKSIASAAIKVDAKDDAARSCSATLGFLSLTDDRLHMELPMETSRRAIGKA